MAFYSVATNLVSGDTNGKYDVFVHDRKTGITERVSVASDGSEGNGDVGLSSGDIPSISADGRYVAFSSGASNLVRGDTNGLADVFIRDRAAGTTERISVASDGSQGLGASTTSAMTPDGRYVVFNSGAPNLVPGDTNGKNDSFIHDRATRTTERVSVAADGTEGNNHTFAGKPGITPDSRFVMFSTNATNLVPGDTNAKVDIYIRDRGGPAPAAAFAITGGDCAVGTVLEAGESCTVEIAFSPESAGIKEGALMVETDDEQAASVMLRGTAPEGPVLAFNPLSLDFDEIEIGATSAPQNAVLTNTGDAEATNLAFTASGGGSDSFDIDTTDCGSILPAGQSCQVVTIFNPASAGIFESALTVEADDERTASVMLRGTTPEEPVLAFNPLRLDFGEVSVGTTSAPQNATLTNTGDTATKLAFTASGGGDFFDADTTDCGNALPAGENCQVVITFTPPGIGLTFAALTAESDEGATARLNLVGEGSSGGLEMIFSDRFEQDGP